MFEKQRARLIEGKDRFDRALVDGMLQNAFHRLIPGKLLTLWRFDDVRERLHLRDRFSVSGVQQVDINKIVGSVGRADEFTRNFLPKDMRQRNRWSMVYAAALSTRELPPVKLYRVGDSYFVVDGHHRVSVLRQMGVLNVEAEVIEWDSPISLRPDARLTMQIPAQSVDASRDTTEVWS